MLYICNVKPPGHGQDGSGDTNKSAPRPVQGRREIRGGPYKPSRGAPAKAPRRGGPLASPRTSRYAARARPERRPFPGTGSLKKAAGDAQANASRPKDAPEHHPHAPLERDGTNPGKKRTLTSLEKSTMACRIIAYAKRHAIERHAFIGFMSREWDSNPRPFRYE